MATARRGGPTLGGNERRANLTLRELLDEMIELTRHLSRNAAHMPPNELTYARERMDWLANEIWEQATRK
jgi:hypothetical protein